MLLTVSTTPASSRRVRVDLLNLRREGTRHMASVAHLLLSPPPPPIVSFLNCCCCNPSHSFTHSSPLLRLWSFCFPSRHFSFPFSLPSLRLSLSHDALSRDKHLDVLGCCYFSFFFLFTVIEFLSFFRFSLFKFLPHCVLSFLCKLCPPTAAGMFMT